jgi:hypothetical protein
MSTFWVRVTAGLGAVGVAVMGIHAVATLSPFGLVYPVLCACMIYTWLELRRRSEEAARGADPLYLMALFFVGRVAEPAFDWLDSWF